MLGNALMAALGIGVKVATLPVIALGVGIGVDYGIYIYTRLESFLRMGLPLQEAYYETLRSTGKAVLFTGLCLAIGVATWIFSAIKFQADMGLMLTFMLLWNMFGAPGCCRPGAFPDQPGCCRPGRPRCSLTESHRASPRPRPRPGFFFARRKAAALQSGVAGNSSSQRKRCSSLL